MADTPSFFCGATGCTEQCGRCAYEQAGANAWATRFSAISGEPLEALSLTEKEGFEPSFPENSVAKRDADIPGGSA